MADHPTTGTGSRRIRATLLGLEGNRTAVAVVAEVAVGTSSRGAISRGTRPRASSRGAAAGSKTKEEGTGSGVRCTSELPKMVRTLDLMERIAGVFF
jgi:hypothetical protein